MASLKDLGKKYGQYLKDTEIISYLSILDIEKKINKLSYKESGKPISKDDKLKIIDFIIEEVNKDIALNEGESVSSLIALINDLKNKIKNG